MQNSPFDNVNSPQVHARQLAAAPDPAWRDHQRALRAQTDNEAKSASRRPDGPAMRALRVVAYVMVIITCLVLLYTTAELYIWVNDVREAFRSWSEGITSTGILGN